jgi:hypothetical protein
VIQATIDTMHQKWSFVDLASPQLEWYPNAKGFLNKRSPKSGTRLDHKETFYADDSAFIFLSKTDLIKGTEFVRSSFAQFGLEVHLGTRANNAKSKTEAMYFPSHSNSRMKYLRISLTETSISQTENLYCLQTNSNTSELTSLRTYQMTPHRHRAQNHRSNEEL